jgi:hypothetical protein
VTFITRNDRGQTDAALVRRFRHAVSKRDRAAAFDAVVRAHRDAVLGRCAERLWPDADAAVAAAHDVFIVAYQAMADPTKLGRPDRLRDWLLAIAGQGGLGSGLPAGAGAINWGKLRARIASEVPDTRGVTAKRVSVRRWLEQIVATLPEARQQLYDLFVRTALDSRNAATELGTDVAEARRLRRDNREALLRAFEVTALAAAEAAPDSLGGESSGCWELRQILADAERDRGRQEGVRRDAMVLSPEARLTVTRHTSQCHTCLYRRDDRVARWAPELLAILAGAELNEQVIEDLRTIPEPEGTPARGLPSRASAGIGAMLTPVRAAVGAGSGLLVVLLLLGFVQPGFFLSTAASAPRSSASSSPQGTGSATPGSHGNPQVIGTSSRVRGRSAPSATPTPGSAGQSPGAVGGPPVPTSSAGTAQPSASSTSASGKPTATPSRSPSPSPSPSKTQPTLVPPTPPSSSPTPTTPTPTPTTPTPSSPSPSSPSP